jgi:transposase
VITIGVDAHKRLHVATAVDDAGKEIDRWQGPNSCRGWADFQAWVARQGETRQIGIEGAWGNGRGLAQHLVRFGEMVFEVNSRWTAAGRRTARRPGKTDRLDARAVALFVWREASTLPPLPLEDETALLNLLTTEREAAVTEATRLRNQIHALLLQIDPEYKDDMPGMRSKAGLARLGAYDVPGGTILQREQAAAVRRLTVRLKLALSQADELGGRIKELAIPYAGLTALCGVNLLTAGTLAAILGPGKRFSTDAELAAYAGAAPLEASSAGAVRHRLNRGGNRRLNAVLYRIALTQARSSPDARTYLARRVSEGKTKREARRALQRYLVRAIWKLWQECLESAPLSTAA